MQTSRLCPRPGHRTEGARLMLKWIAVCEGGHRNPITTEKDNLELPALKELTTPKLQAPLTGTG
jgi:hypothetical protein